MKLFSKTNAFVALTAVVVASAVQVAIGAFVTTSGTSFVVDGCKKVLSGANTYYVTVQSSTLVDHAFQLYKNHSLDVMRAWAFCESKTSCGNGPFVTFDSNAKTATADDTQLKRLDLVVSEAQNSGVLLLLGFTNNWEDFGGMDEWVKNLGGTFHDDFYTSTTIKTQFKSYISQILNRKNSITGVVYKDDPTIMAWELANEARCSNGGLATSGSCTTSTINSWYDEISKHIKSVDSNHLVGTGDEGFGVATTSKPASNSYVYTTGEGTDFKANLQLSAIDYGTFHMYPINYGLTNIPTDGDEWIKAHTTAAAAVGKPVMIGEFGLTDKSLRSTNYNEWYQTALDNGIGATLFWMAAGTDYPDFDGFTLYDSDITTLVDPNTAKYDAKSGCSSSGSGGSTGSTTTAAAVVSSIAAASSTAAAASSAAPASSAAATSRPVAATTTTRSRGRRTITTTAAAAATTTRANLSTSCAAQYAQCGGKTFTGSTCCQSGLTCKTLNEYFSQCL